MPVNKTYKFEEFWARGLPRCISKAEMEKAYNAADSRFYRAAKANPTQSENPAKYAALQRENGTTLLEAMASIVYDWACQKPGSIPGHRHGTMMQLRMYYGLEITSEYFGFARNVDRRRPDPLAAGGFYHRQFNWVRKISPATSRR
ncbi:hypothetical protein F5B20DRAFT_161796 [Whalleya microplaca]|nr:hypothetical protein F5B20DRAFT_161796 [Whalleya microplaca]